MADQVLLSAGIENIRECVALAQAHDLGVELMAFAFPGVLDGDWRATLALYQRMLRPLRGPLTLHGPFMDMAPGSPDAKIVHVTRERYRHALRCAADLNAQLVVFHANYIAAIQTLAYRQGWHKRNVEFWGTLAEDAARLGVRVAVENMWEFDPTLIADMVAEVNHPSLGTCLDVGHAVLYGADHSFEAWLSAFTPWLLHVHMNNTDGKADDHRALADGVIDYSQVLGRLRALNKPVTMVLEMYHTEDMRASLPYFALAQAPGRV